MKWRTKDGGITDTKEMSELHLTNAYKYCIRLRDYNGATICQEELQRRSDEKYYSRRKKCPYCKGVMKPTEYVYDEIEVGFSLPEYTYRFECVKCGSTSGEIKAPKRINLDE